MLTQWELVRQFLTVALMFLLLHFAKVVLQGREVGPTTGGIVQRSRTATITPAVP